jgi:sarcosine oxidase subunit beta
VRCEVIVVGGGGYGCGLAWELACRGVDVVLLEKDDIAAGASGGPGARGVRSSGRDLRELPLVRHATQLWPDLAQRLRHPTGYTRTGGLRLVEKEAVGTRGGRVSLEAHSWVLRRAGIPARVLDRAELLELEPDIGPGVTHALLCPLDGVVDHTLTSHSYAAAARRLGASIREHEPVTALTWRGHEVAAVETPAETYLPSRAVVLLENTGVADLTASTDSPNAYLPTWHVVPQVTLVRPRTPVRISHLIGHDSRPLSLKSAPRGEVQISGGWRGTWDPILECGVVDPEMVAASLAEAAAVYPGLHDAQLVHTDASRTESCTTDGIPIIDRLPSSTNTFLAHGWSAHGYALVPAVTTLLADWITTGARPHPLEPFGHARFTGKAPVTATTFG